MDCYKWKWETQATYGYNILAKFEETLINLEILSDYSSIDESEGFDKKYSLLPKPLKDFYDSRRNL